MNVNKIIEKIRNKCPIFERRVGGASELPIVEETTNLETPYAFVVPTAETGGELESQNGYQQEITNEFSVLVFVSNTADERGHTGVNSLVEIRRQLFACLLGWKIEPDYEAIWFDTGSHYARNRALLAWEYQFKFIEAVSTADTSIEVDYNEMPNLTNVNVGIDAIDPMADPNHPVTGKYPGKDGRIEHKVNIVLT